MIPHAKHSSRPGQTKLPCMECGTPSHTVYCDTCCGGMVSRHAHDSAHEDHAPARGRHLSVHVSQGNPDIMAKEAVRPSRYRYNV
jgi:hypothetical protein